MMGFEKMDCDWKWIDEVFLWYCFLRSRSLLETGYILLRVIAVSRSTKLIILRLLC